VDSQSFYNCISCYMDQVDTTAYDGQAFADALWMTIVEPLQHAQDTFDRLPYVTRLYTTLSAEEMTLDPIFAFNADLEPFSNVHVADAIVDCGEGGDYYTSPVIVRLADGREIITTRSGGDRTALDAMPAAQSFAETGASGPPVVLRDNNAEIEVALAEFNAIAADQFLAPRSVRGGGCSTSPTPSAPAALWLGLLGLVAVRRRR
jgi:MYXO-CTERM domain-containing protein